jgi:hypothetical protein
MNRTSLAVPVSAPDPLTTSGTAHISFLEKTMITDDTVKQSVYHHVLKNAQKRLAQTIPGSEESTFSHLSLAAVLNLLFLLRGEWGSIGDFGTTHRAVRALVGDDLLWAEPQKSSPASLELVH